MYLTDKLKRLIFIFSVEMKGIVYFKNQFEIINIARIKILNLIISTFPKLYLN